MRYQDIRNRVQKYKTLFVIVRFFFTPIRIVKEFMARRKMAGQIIKEFSEQQLTNTIFYIGIPEHTNLGDLAQTYCTRQILNELYPDYRVIEMRTRVALNRRMIHFIKRSLGDEGMIVFQSGYCTRDKNPDHIMHKYVARRLSDRKLICLPQTVKISSQRECRRTKEVYTKCKKLLFICRDKISYENAKAFLPDQQIACFPDIVTSLIGRVDYKKVKRSGVLVCIRNDAEKYYTEGEISQLRKRLLKRFETVHLTDTNCELDISEIYDELEKILKEKINEFSQYEVIITDRYHGTIFSLIADTPVIVIKTKDHKVTSGVDWFSGVFERYSVQLADTLDSAVDMAEYVHMNCIQVKNGDYFYQSYYQNTLFDLINRTGEQGQ